MQCRASRHLGDEGGGGARGRIATRLGAAAPTRLVSIDCPMGLDCAARHFNPRPLGASIWSRLGKQATAHAQIPEALNLLPTTGHVIKNQSCKEGEHRHEHASRAEDRGW